MYPIALDRYIMYLSLMKLTDWINQHLPAERPRVRLQMGEHLGFSEVYIRSMANGNRDVPATSVLPMAEYTQWQVTPHEIRDDIYRHPADGMPARSKLRNK